MRFLDRGDDYIEPCKLFFAPEESGRKVRHFAPRIVTCNYYKNRVQYEGDYVELWYNGMTHEEDCDKYGSNDKLVFGDRSCYLEKEGEVVVDPRGFFPFVGRAVRLYWRQNCGSGHYYDLEGPHQKLLRMSAYQSYRLEGWLDAGATPLASAIDRTNDVDKISYSKLFLGNELHWVDECLVSVCGQNAEFYFEYEEEGVKMKWRILSNAIDLEEAKFCFPMLLHDTHGNETFRY